MNPESRRTRGATFFCLRRTGPIRYNLEPVTPAAQGTARVSIRARQNPRASTVLLGRLSDEQRALWHSIGTGRSVSDLAGGGTSSRRVLEQLQTLQAMGTIVIEEERTLSPLDGSALDNPSPEEESLLAEECDLADWERRRILAVVRAVNEGQYMGLLDLPKGATRRDLKRAYYTLSKDFHPDRYYGRNLGSFQPLFERVFAAICQFVKTLSDSRTVTGELSTAPGPRRRRSARFALAVDTQLRCSGWPDPRSAVSQDLSAGGVFVITESMAGVGDRVDLQLMTEPGEALALRGRVVSRREPEAAAAAGLRPGLGIQFAPPAEPERRRLQALLDIARESAPDFGKRGDRPRRRMARGTGTSGHRNPIVGIDLGTTNTSISVAIGDRVQILQWPGGTYSIPSVVAFPRRGVHVVGHEAVKLMLRDPRLGIASAKRLLGRHVDDPELAGYLHEARFARRNGPDGHVVASFWNEHYAMPQICSYLLAAARESAEKNLKMPVHRAVLTVPVSFGDKRVALMRRAAKLAHLEVVDVIEEPTAGAIAHRRDRDFGGVIGVYDFGGGTFDFSLVDASEGDLRVLTTAGDSWLGGDDFDLAIAEAAADLFWRAHGLDLRHRAVEWQYLLLSCERAKRQLSGDTRAQIVVPEVLRTQKGAFDLRINLRRDKVESLWAKLVKRSIDTTLQALALADMRSSELSAIYLSGGTSYIPLIHRALAQRLGVPVRVRIPPEYTVCAGAGFLAAQRERASAGSSVAAALPTLS